MDLVSVLIPVYNIQPYLDKSIDSIRHQTYPNLEIICIDDGSTDGSLDLLRFKERIDPRIRVYSYPNGGVSRTRNRALSHANGDYIMFVDGDDWIDPDMIQTMMAEAKLHDLDFVQCGFRMDYKYGSLYRCPSGHRQFTNISALKALAAGAYLNNYPWAKLMRRHLFDGVHFPENMTGFEDTYTLFQAIARSKRVGTIPDRFYHYVQRRGSITNRMSISLVEQMRKAYEHQDASLKKMFPHEHFSFDLQYYNTDMVILYTLIVFYSRKDDMTFSPADIDWKALPLSPVLRAAYQAWRGIAALKCGPQIMEDAPEEQPEESKTAAS